MKPYLVSLAVGLLVGVVYGILNVRSPAPPVVALVGLFRILAGEQIPPMFRHAFGTGLGRLGSPGQAACFRSTSERRTDIGEKIMIGIRTLSRPVHDPGSPKATGDRSGNSGRRVGAA